MEMFPVACLSGNVVLDQQRKVKRSKWILTRKLEHSRKREFGRKISQGTCSGAGIFSSQDQGHKAVSL